MNIYTSYYKYYFSIMILAIVILYGSSSTVYGQSDFNRDDSYDFSGVHIIKAYGNDINNFSIKIESNSDFRLFKLKVVLSNLNLSGFYFANKYRVDMNNDGNWEQDWTASNKTISYYFPNPTDGISMSQTIRIEIKYADNNGQSSNRSKTYQITIFSTPRVYHNSENDVFVQLRDEDCSSKIPVLFVEGFDPLNENYPEKYYNLTWYLVNSDLYPNGYEVFILNFNGGGRDLRLNANVIQRSLEKIHEICPNFKIVLGGLSMGGLISRYALAKSEDSGIKHHVGLFMSYDSPQDGAHISPGLQDWIKGQAPSEEAIIKLQGNLNSMAAKQMLRYNTYDNSTPENTLRDQFYGELNGMNDNGYPHNSFNVALSNGNFNATWGYGSIGRDLLTLKINDNLIKDVPAVDLDCGTGSMITDITMTRYGDIFPNPIINIYYELSIVFNPVFIPTWSGLDLDGAVIDNITGNITSFSHSNFDTFLVQTSPLEHHELSTLSRNSIMDWLDLDFNIDVNYNLLNGGSTNPDNYQVNILHGLPIEIQTQNVTVNGKQVTYNFLEWEDGNTSNPRTFFTSHDVTHTAYMKGHMVSNNAQATGYNNGRRLVRAGSSYHLVYEDNGDIYYTSSIDGTNWTKDRIISHGGGLCKNPSISRGEGNHINVIWELHEESGPVKIFFRRRSGSSWQGIKWCMNFTQTHDARPVIAAYGGGSFLVVVCEGPDGLYYGSSTGSSSGAFPMIISKVPTTNQYSVFPSVQATTYPCGLAWQESSKIYYMKFTHSNGVITWNTSSRTQIGSGIRPSVEGDYYNTYPEPDYYTIAYQGNGGYASIPIRVYRSKTGTYTSFESWLKFHQIPSLFSNQETNTEYSLVWYEGYGNDVLQSNYTNNQWSSPSVLSANGRHPTINSGNGYGGALSGPSTAVWADGGSSPYLIKTTSTGLSKAASYAQRYLRRVEIDLSFLNPEISKGSVAGNISLDIFRYKTKKHEESFHPLHDKNDKMKFLDSQPVLLSADTLEVQYVLKAKNLEVKGKIDKKVLETELFKLYLNNLQEQLTTIKIITLKDIIDFNNSEFNLKNTIKLSFTKSRGKTGYVCGTWPKQAVPILTEVYIIGEPDSLYRGISKEKAMVFEETINETKMIPESFTLSQNYPNPFNPTTHIQLDLPEGVDVKLEVYNIRGQKVAVLIDGYREAGSYEVLFDGRRLGSGVYFYRVITPRFTDVKRMLLVK